jgi:hypothetical protein
MALKNNSIERKRSQSLGFRIKKYTASLVVGTLIGTVSFFGWSNYHTGIQAQEMYKSQAAIVQQVENENKKLNELIIEMKSDRLMDGLEEIKWDQLEELWHEVSDHASVEEEMRHWLENQLQELKSDSQVCIDTNNPHLKFLESNAQRALEKISKAPKEDANKTQRKNLLFKEAHKSILEWEAALLDICPKSTK